MNKIAWLLVNDRLDTLDRKREADGSLSMKDWKEYHRLQEARNILSAIERNDVD